MIGHDTYAYRRDLPHLEKTGKTYFVTFSTARRRVLKPGARGIALDCCIDDDEVTYWLHCVTVMPDHVHMLFTPYEEWSLSKIVARVKGVSAHRINRAESSRGCRWQRVVRSHRAFG